MKRTSIWFGKALLSGVIAFLISTVFCFFYYNLPVHQVSKSGATDFSWNKNHISMRATEGFSVTKTDEFGFVNTFPEKKEKADVLVMGSSHTEGFNVNWNQNFTYLLNQKFYENGDDKFAYNIGTSNHAFLRCMKNLEAAVETYKPLDSVVIETSLIEFDFQELKKLNSGKFESISVHEPGILTLLQKNDFFRLTYYQASNFMEKDAEPLENAAPEKIDLAEYSEQIDAVLQKASQIGKENHCRIIVVYCPKTKIDYQGKMFRDPYTDEEKAFIESCEKHGIELLDLYSAFETEYQKSNQLPHGFSNSAVGVGHLNATGHKTVAEEIYSAMMKGE